jgi:hypothetical protein
LLNESWTSLAAAVVILGASFVGRGDLRRLITLVALIGLLVAMLRMPLHVSIPEGDYRNFVDGREGFRSYMVEQVSFEYHLSSQIVRGFDAALGSTDSSPVAAFHWLSRLIALVFVAGLVGLGFVERWSERVVRYLALAVAVPATALLLRIGNAAVYGVAGWVAWIPVYPILLHSDLAAGHADEAPLRPLFHPKPYPDYHRIADPVFSSLGLPTSATSCGSPA